MQFTLVAMIILAMLFLVHHASSRFHIACKNRAVSSQNGVQLSASQVGLGVTWSPRDPRFAGSNPAEVDGFFQDVNILSTSPPGGSLSCGF